MEKIFRNTLHLLNNNNIKNDQICNMVLNSLEKTMFCTCGNNIIESIVKLYIRSRVYFYVKKRNQNNRTIVYSSKSMNKNNRRYICFFLPHFLGEIHILQRSTESKPVLLSKLKTSFCCLLQVSMFCYSCGDLR